MSASSLKVVCPCVQSAVQSGRSEQDGVNPSHLTRFRVPHAVNQSVSAWGGGGQGGGGVMRSRRSSVWPSPFSSPPPTSQSGTEAGPGEGSSPRGTEAVCLCSGRVGRSHTVGKEVEKKQSGE